MSKAHVSEPILAVSNGLNLIPIYYIILYYIILYYIILCYITLYYITTQHVQPCNIISYNTATNGILGGTV